MRRAADSFSRRSGLVLGIVRGEGRAQRVIGLIARELEEIGYTGGTVALHVVTGVDGRRGYQVEFHHQRPVAAPRGECLTQRIVVAPADGGNWIPLATATRAGLLPDLQHLIQRACSATSAP